MSIKRLVITKLFGQFDYDIPLDNVENMCILTGPNGYGKTTVLNIIDNIINNNFTFFFTLPFEYITFFLKNNFEFKVYKNNETRIIYITLKKDTDVIEVNIDAKRAVQAIFKSMEENVWFKKEKEKIYTKSIDASTWINENKEQLNSVAGTLVNEHIEKTFSDIDNYKRITKELQKNKVYFIKEQRLFKKIDDNGAVFTINEYQKQLKDKIESYMRISEVKRSELDANLAMRLLENNKALGENDYNQRFESVRTKQNKLKQYGLADFELKIPNYTQDGAKILSAYLDDIEEKLAVYDNLIYKLDIFTQFIEKRIFTNKSIHINKAKGFIFRINDGAKTEELQLNDLSSGEQHQIILLFELIFNLESGSIVLIDEPEISLHVAWMRMFISDLLEILKLHNAQAIVVTHSPQIIDVHSNLQYDLYAAQNNNKEEVANAS